jgi:hypothetical protein
MTPLNKSDSQQPSFESLSIEEIGERYPGKDLSDIMAFEPITLKLTPEAMKQIEGLEQQSSEPDPPQF